MILRESDPSGFDGLVCGPARLTLAGPESSGLQLYKMNILTRLQKPTRKGILQVVSPLLLA